MAEVWEPKDHNKSALEEFPFYITILPKYVELVRHSNPCVHNSKNRMFFWVVPLSCLPTLVYQLIVKSMRAFVRRCYQSCGPSSHSILEWLGETNSSTSSISRIGSKQLCSADQNASPAFDSVLPWSITIFILGISWELHTILWTLDIVLLLAIIIHSSVPMLL